MLSLLYICSIYVWVLCIFHAHAINISLDFTPSIIVDKTIINHLDTVRMTFKGLTLNDTSAWFGLFYPSSADISMIQPPTAPYSSSPYTYTYPMKFLMCSQIKSCLETGTPTITSLSLHTVIPILQTISHIRCWIL